MLNRFDEPQELGHLESCLASLLSQSSSISHAHQHTSKFSYNIMISFEFEVLPSVLGTSDTGPVFIWYGINTKFCGIPPHYLKEGQTHVVITSMSTV